LMCVSCPSVSIDTTTLIKIQGKTSFQHHLNRIGDAAWICNFPSRTFDQHRIPDQSRDSLRALGLQSNRGLYLLFWSWMLFVSLSLSVNHRNSGNRRL
jgi:hypothetical protein